MLGVLRAPRMIDSEDGIKQALDRLAIDDRALAALIADIGYPLPRKRDQGFASLLATIISQQISVKAAASIRAKVMALFTHPPSAHQLLEFDDQRLREAGLSRQKLGYVRDLAQAIIDGRLPLETLNQLDDEQAIEAISSVRGLGRWSAEIYLMFAESRADLWPADDLALQVAIGNLRGLATRPTAKQTRVLSQSWTPYRSAAALMMWHYYGSTSLS